MKYQFIHRGVPGLAAAALIYVAGELDLHVAERLREDLRAALTPETQYALILLGDVAFIDSHNLGCFVGAYQTLASRGGWVGLAVQQPNLRRVFDLTNLDKLFRFFDGWDGFANALVQAGLLDSVPLCPTLDWRPV